MKNFALYLSVGLLAAVFASPIKAQPAPSDILLIVNDSIPKAVTFTATTNDPVTSDSSHTFNDGIDLANFFSSPNDLEEGLSPTTLTTFVDGAPNYDRAESDDIDITDGLYEDLALFTGELESTGETASVVATPGPGSTETFETGMTAFTGSATLDLSEFASALPTPGTGTLYAGYSGDEPPPDTEFASAFSFADFLDQIDGLTAIGEYQIIPEPSQWSLLLIGATGLFALRRFRASRV